MQKKIDQLTDHTVVCGYGRMGKTIAEQLHRGNQPIVVVEAEPGKTEEIERSGMRIDAGDCLYVMIANLG